MNMDNNKNNENWENEVLQLLQQLAGDKNNNNNNNTNVNDPQLKHIQEKALKLLKDRSMNNNNNDNKNNNKKKNDKQQQNMNNDNNNNNNKITIIKQNNNDEQRGNDVDLALIYSSPLVIKNNNDILPLDALEHAREQRLLLSSLKETNASIRIRSYPATTDMFRLLLTNQCSILHFSGHGFSDLQSDDAIAFEDAEGCAHLVDMNMLNKLLDAGIGRLQVVLIAACNSFMLGSAFISAGVKYVVCVQRHEKILDRSSLIFSRAFYHSLFSGHSIHDAFAAGQARVATESELPEIESTKFMLLSNPEYSESDVFFVPSAGKLKDLTPKPLYHRLPAKSQSFVGRNYDVHSIMGLLVNKKYRLVTIRGPPGIGKTSLCKTLGHYVLQRQIWSNGVLYCPMRGCDSISSIYQAIYQAINTSLGYEKNSGEITSKHVENFVSSRLQDLDLLLIWDNCEEIIRIDSPSIRKIIEFITSLSDNISLLITSRIAIGGGVPGISEKIYTLSPLDSLAAARLFEQHSPRRITSTDLGIETHTSLTPKQALRALAQHETLRFLGGHPQAITLAAPLLQDRSLNDLQHIFATKSLEVLRDVDEEAAVINTLIASLDASIEHLMNTKPKCVDFFCLMALLPAGAIAIDFQQIWGTDWKELVLPLIRASLIIRSEVRIQRRIVERYFTFPFVTQYAKRRLKKNPPLMSDLLYKCRNYFSKMCLKMFNSIGTSSRESSMVYEKLNFYQLNLFAIMEKMQPVDGLRGIQPLNEVSSIGVLASCLCSVLYLAGRIEESVRIAHLGLEAATHIEDKLSEANLRKFLAVLETRTYSTLEKAKRNLSAALILYKQFRCVLGQGITLSITGYVQMKLQNFVAARHCYERAMNCFDKLSHRIALLNCYKWLAILCKKTPGLANRAIEYYQLAKQIQTEIAHRKSNKYLSKWNGHDVSLHLQIPTDYTHDDGKVFAAPQFSDKPLTNIAPNGSSALARRVRYDSANRPRPTLPVRKPSTTNWDRKSLSQLRLSSKNQPLSSLRESNSPRLLSPSTDFRLQLLDSSSVSSVSSAASTPRSTISMEDLPTFTISKDYYNHEDIENPVTQQHQQHTPPPPPSILQKQYQNQQHRQSNISLKEQIQIYKANVEEYNSDSNDNDDSNHNNDEFENELQLELDTDDTDDDSVIFSNLSPSISSSTGNRKFSLNRTAPAGFWRGFNNKGQLNRNNSDDTPVDIIQNIPSRIPRLRRSSFDEFS